MVSQDEAVEIAKKYLEVNYRGTVDFHSVGFVSADKWPPSYQFMGDVWVSRFRQILGPNGSSGGMILVNVSKESGQVIKEPRPQGR